MNRNHALRFLIVITLISGAACSTTIHRDEIPVIDHSISDPARSEKLIARSEPPAITESINITEALVGISGSSYRSNPAVSSLLTDAKQELNLGHLDSAAALIETSLELDPKNPLLWNRLANVRLSQKNWQQAYVLANKSNSLSLKDTQIQVDNWHIIEQAKIKQGDKEGAEHAGNEISRLKTAPSK